MDRPNHIDNNKRSAAEAAETARAAVAANDAHGIHGANAVYSAHAMHDASGANDAHDAPWAAREAGLLAPYAMHSARTAGRIEAEPSDPYRGPYEIDRQRLLGSAAFRRLSHKTQVFTGELGDYHRTRLTHTLEVAAIARRLARALALNEDLVETLALLHDLGHPPFGHAGEAALATCLEGEGGFCHNRYALDLVARLERCDPRFAGLNLSREVLAGQAWRAEKAASPMPLFEVQAVDAADSVAYNTHDADDALHLGLLQLDELLRLPLWREAAARVRRRFAALEPDELRRAVLAELLEWQTADLVAEFHRRLAQHPVRSIADVASAPLLIEPGDTLAEPQRELERFLFDRVYRHPQVLAKRQEAGELLCEMFERLVTQPEQLPPAFQQRLAQGGVRRTVADYLAGMTDRYAQQVHTALRSARPPVWRGATSVLS